MNNPTNGLKTEILEKSVDTSLFAYFRAISILNEKAGLYGVVYLPDKESLEALDRIEKERASQTVTEILKEYLESRGFDGLANSDIECGCFMDDLAPCGEINSNCVAGYKVVIDGMEVCIDKPLDTLNPIGLVIAKSY